ncbi:MAG: prephenate dehydrogenase/arogenate dehydrogenase family protein [Ignavibacteria bacterium]|nr:prephenate dehydrogenase/arogenate dehydrogenase family protein [Ignavibacteria bacterium]
MTKQLAIIGHGRFGQLAARHLKKHFSVVVVDKRSAATKTRGIKSVSLSEAAGKKIIILAVPINKLRSVLSSIGPFIGEGTLVVDVCSVKEQPIKWMKTLLPKHISILGTHPLFGPDSAAQSIKGKPIVLCPVRISKQRLDHVRGVLKKLGLHSHQMTPAQHDKLMASTLFLTQFIGRGMLALGLPKTSIATQNYRLLQQITITSGSDSLELFRDMFRYNRFARRIPQKTLTHFQRIIQLLSRR